MKIENREYIFNYATQQTSRNTPEFDTMLSSKISQATIPSNTTHRYDISTFKASLNHEVKNAIAPSKMVAQMLKSKMASGLPISNEELKEAMEIVISSADKVDQFINNMNKLDEDSIPIKEYISGTYMIDFNRVQNSAC